MKTCSLFQIFVNSYFCINICMLCSRHERTCTSLHHGELTFTLYKCMSLCFFVTQLALTKHASDVQLKVSDLSVRPLWQNFKIKKVLSATGCHQIGLLLNFNKTPMGTLCTRNWPCRKLKNWRRRFFHLVTKSVCLIYPMFRNGSLLAKCTSVW